MNIQPAKFHALDESGQIWQPQRVILFSGHMIDAPERKSARFPAEKAILAAECITAALEQLQIGPNDLAITQGACGGDILFAEACLHRGAKLQLLQPFNEAEFIEKSVAPGGQNWLQRYQAITARLPSPPLAAPSELGPLPASMNAYERCNLWLLHTALAYAGSDPIFVCLWDGGGGDGPGGTAHMVNEVKKHCGKVLWLDTRTL